MYVDPSPGQESQLSHVLIYQPQLLLSLTLAAADPIPPGLLLYYSYIIFSFMFLHDPTILPMLYVLLSIHDSQSDTNFPSSNKLPRSVMRGLDALFSSVLFQRDHRLGRDPKASFTLTLLPCDQRP